jgi:hypothetical protein
VGVETIDAPARETDPDPRIQPVRWIAPDRVARGQDGVMGDAAGERWLGQDPVEHGLRRGGGIGAHRDLEIERLCELAGV